MQRLQLRGFSFWRSRSTSEIRDGGIGGVPRGVHRHTAELMPSHPSLTFERFNNHERRNEGADWRHVAAFPFREVQVSETVKRLLRFARSLCFAPVIEMSDSKE